MSDAPVHGAEVEIVRDARREHLGDLLAFVDQACARAGVSREVLFDVRLAVEEVVTNVIDHGYAGLPTGPVTVRFHSDPRQIVVTIEDLARPFDPSRVAGPDVGAPIEQRAIGGLGWHLVHHLMDEVRHTHGGTHGNRVTLVKRLSTTD
ncbi:MAG: ATP-binding protein [Gemmatimonadaceae bacterium]